LQRKSARKSWRKLLQSRSLKKKIEERRKRDREWKPKNGGKRPKKSAKRQRGKLK
jgi:hypothetical protein